MTAAWPPSWLQPTVAPLAPAPAQDAQESETAPIDWRADLRTWPSSWRDKWADLADRGEAEGMAVRVAEEAAWRVLSAQVPTPRMIRLPGGFAVSSWWPDEVMGWPPARRWEHASRTDQLRDQGHPEPGAQAFAELFTAWLDTAIPANRLREIVAFDREVNAPRRKSS